SFTLGQADPIEMARRAHAARAWPILKIKVGTPHDVENLRAVRGAAPNALLRLDANGAWPLEEAIDRIEALAKFGVELVEQPRPPGDPAALGRVRERMARIGCIDAASRGTAIPIFADEGIRCAADVERHAGCVDGIVVKLGKCGGYLAVLECIEVARRLGLR